MARRTVQAVITYKIVAAELWGNARDGFDTNDWHTLEERKTAGGYSKQYLTQWVRNLFEGRNFNWSEGKSRPMSRPGIELHDVGWESMLSVQYRGHDLGTIEWKHDSD